MVGAHGIVGREAELDALTAAVGHLVSGAPAVVAVEGPPGIGKTTLLRALTHEAEAAGALVVRATAVEAESGVPYAPLAEPLGRLLSDAHIARRIDDPTRAVLEGVVRGESPAGGARHHVHRAVRDLLAATAVRRPAALVVDDLHWADPATIETFLLLLARPPARPVLLGLGLRHHPGAERLRRAATDATGTWWLALQPLVDAAAEALLPGDGLPRTARRRVLDAAGGNPFVLLELARAAGDRTGGGRREVPPAVATALADELARLPGDVRRTAHAAAVVGAPFRPSLVAQAAELPLADVLAALDHLTAAGLVEPAGASAFRCRHPLVADAWYADAPPAWRIGAHARVAAELTGRGAPASAIAPHVALCAEPGDAAAVALLGGAARDVLARAPSVAARWLGTAVDLAWGAAAGQRVPLLSQLARARSSAGDFGGARSVVETLLSELPAGSGELRANALGVLARTEQVLQLWDLADQHLDEAMGEAPAGSEVAVVLSLRRASAALQRGRYDEMVDLGRTALDAAVALGTAPLEAAAHAKLATATYHVGDVATAREHADRAGRLVDAGDAQQLARNEALVWLGWAEWFLERPDAALGHLDRAAAVFDAGAGHETMLVTVLAGRAEALVSLGRVAEGLVAAEESSDLALLLGLPELRVLAAATYAEALLVAGRPTDAARAAAAALDATRGDGGSTLLCRLRLAAARLADGNARAGLTLLLDACGGDDLPTLEPTWRASWHEVAVHAALAADDRARARDQAARAARWADVGLPGRAAAAARAEAAVALADGRAEAARAAAARAVEVLGDGRSDVPGAVRAALLLGRALAAAGDRAGAVHTLQAAEQRAAAAGVVGAQEPLRQELRRLGRRGPYRARAGRKGPLTAREHEVAALAAEGRTNREIAAALFISEHTVETHLRKARAKLGVRSRAGLGAVLPD